MLIPAIIAGFLLILVVVMAVVFSRPAQPAALPPIIDGDLSPQQLTALQRLAQESTEQVSVYADEGIIRILDLQLALPAQDKAAVLSFFNTYQELFNLSDPATQLVLQDEQATVNGYSSYRFSQAYNGVPVYGSDVIFQFDPSGNLVRYSGGYAPELSISTAPTITTDGLNLILEGYFGTDEFETISDPQLMIYDERVFGFDNPLPAALVWYVEAASAKEISGLIINALSGEVLTKESLLVEIGQFEVVDAEGEYLNVFKWLFAPPKNVILNNSGKLNENQEIDEEADRVWKQMEQASGYFENFGYTFDEPIKAFINVDMENCPNAKWWDSPKRKWMIYCDNATQSMDALAHELTHGISAKFVDFKCTGRKASETCALNEAFSDIFAAFIDDQHSWQICIDDCVIDGNEERDLIRDLANPKNDKGEELPDHKSNFIEIGNELCKEGSPEAEDDRCGHVNSTIFSHVVYLMVNGGDQYGVQVVGIGKSKAEQILFHTLANGNMSRNADFKMAAKTTIDTCRSMIGTHGISDLDCNNVRNAFAAAGIAQVVPTAQPTAVIATPDQTAIAPVRVNPAAQPFVVQDSQTVLVVDVSGSMEDLDASGALKIDAAKRAAGNLLDVIRAEQSTFSTTIHHEVGLVSFSSEAQVLHTLTETVGDVQATVQNLTPLDMTAMAAGLSEGMNLFDPASSAKQILILMSDGLPNIPLNEYEVDDYEDVKAEIINLSSQAGAQGICVYTVGFGNTSSDPESTGYIDEQLLRDIAVASTCGEYYNAQNAGELANVFLQLRHSSLGKVVLQESGEIAQDEEQLVGSVNIPKNQEQMLFTLNWPGSKLEPKLFDPRGKMVTPQYSGATVTQGDTVASVVILEPLPGVWTVRIVGRDVPSGRTTYNAVMSIRESASTSSPNWMWAAVIALILASGAAIAGIALSSRGRRRPRGRSGAYLVFTEGPMRGMNVPLQKQTLIGRGNQCQVIIPDLSVSKQHAYIYLTAAGWLIQDLGSKAGLRVNEHLAQASYLQPGDRVALGDTSFIFMSR